MEYCKLYRDSGNVLIHIMNLYHDNHGCEHVEIRVEKENDAEAYARFLLPANYCTHAYGFPEIELIKIKKFLINNAIAIWDMARGNIRAEGSC